MPPQKTQKKRRFEAVVDDDIFNHEEDSKRPCLSFFEDFEQRAQTQRVLDRWSEFEVKWMANLPAAEKEDYIPDLRAPPSVTAIRKFFQWMVRHIPGQSERRLSVQTLKRIFNELKRVIKYRTEYTYEKHVRDGMNKYIESLAVTEGASVDVAPKGLANFAVLEDILYFLWVCDDYTFNHPRFRLQLAFGMLLCSFRGIRPGEVVESSLHRRTNDGLKYKDVKLILTDAEGFILLVRRRLKKGARNQANRVTWEPFFQSPENRACCVVTHFLALAIADGALTMAAITNTRIDPGANSKTLAFPEKVQELPIIRAMDSDQHSISATNILTFAVWNSCLVKLGQRAGYEEKLTSYCFRRGVGNALDKEITSAERQREMGHRSELTFLHYLSKVSGVDSQAIVMGEEQRTSSIEFVRSMNFNRDLQAPNPYSLQASGSRASPSTNSREESMRLCQEKRKSDNEDYMGFFAMSTTASQSPSPALEDTNYDYITKNGIKRVRPKPTRLTRILFKYDTIRAEVANTFYPNADSGEEAKSLSIAEATAVLTKLANPERWSLSYPVPCEDDECTWCGKVYDRRTGRARFNDHLLECHQAHWQRSKQKQNDTHNVIRKHCTTNHIEPSPVIGKPCTTNHIEPSPARTDCTIPSIDLDISRCLWQHCHFDFVDKPVNTIVKHMTSHVLHTRGNRCRWHNCHLPTSNPRELSTHLLDSHNVPSEYTLADKAFFCHQCVKWFESTLAWDQHCEGHLQDLKDNFCGRVARAGAVIFAGLCPFCLGRAGAPSQRCQQFPEAGWKIKTHLEKHLKAIGRSTYTCPHPLCNDEIKGAKETFQHLSEKHGMDVCERKRGKKRSKKEATSTESEEDGSFDEELLEKSEEDGSIDQELLE